MNRKMIARELVEVAKLLTAAGETYSGQHYGYEGKMMVNLRLDIKGSAVVNVVGDKKRGSTLSSSELKYLLRDVLDDRTMENLAQRYFTMVS